MTRAAANRVRVSGDGQLAVRHDDCAGIDAPWTVGARNRPFDLQIVDGLFAHMESRALRPIPV
ncbi:MAG: hypothetical protein VX528_09735, partial [Candidatus Latescibacterota bacterium]|nr:hypothetical protein [Candidatus Latescibacterota bacterium]